MEALRGFARARASANNRLIGGVGASEGDRVWWIGRAGAQVAAYADGTLRVTPAQRWLSVGVLGGQLRVVLAFFVLLFLLLLLVLDLFLSVFQIFLRFL